MLDWLRSELRGSTTGSSKRVGSQATHQLAWFKRRSPDGNESNYYICNNRVATQRSLYVAAILFSDYCFYLLVSGDKRFPRTLMHLKNYLGRKTTSCDVTVTVCQNGPISSRFRAIIK